MSNEKMHAFFNTSRRYPMVSLNPGHVREVIDAINKGHYIRHQTIDDALNFTGGRPPSPKFVGLP
jgi:hypothetical protein